MASGPVVSGTASYKGSLLARRDRKYVALEMEAAGVMAAAADRRTATLVIRGISDPADEGKLGDDKAGVEGALRKVAMRNAVEFLFLLMELQLLVHGGPDTTDGQTGETSPAEGAKPSLPPAEDKIAFSYLPDAVQLHGWRIGVDGPETPLPTIRPLSDPDLGTALSLIGPSGARLDYDVPEPARGSDLIDIVFAETGEMTFYVRLSVVRATGKRSVWLAILPDTPGGTSEPKPLGNGENEWHCYVRPTPGPGRWSVMTVDLRDAVTRTFGKEGWTFDQLLGFRVRGTTYLGRIGLLRKAAPHA